jgi:hypothetical protein
VSWEVAVTKAILLTTRGRIGPAFDSNVSTNLGVLSIFESEQLVSILSRLTRELAAFESRHSLRIENLVPAEWGPVAVGRAIDMLLGPKEKN